MCELEKERQPCSEKALVDRKGSMSYNKNAYTTNSTNDVCYEKSYAIQVRTQREGPLCVGDQSLRWSYLEKNIE